MTCPACSSPEHRLSGSIEGYVQGTQFSILNCNACGTSFADPHREDSRVYEYIYRNAKDTPGYARYYEYAQRVTRAHSPIDFLIAREPAYYAVYKTIAASRTANPRILEIGCGMGYFTYALNQAGYACEGIDISEEAIRRASEWFGPYFRTMNIFSMPELPEEKRYDVIFMTELIEHVEDPGAFIAAAKKFLAPGGMIIVTTPNKDWYRTPILWASDIPPVHLTWFSEAGTRYLGTHHGLATKLYNFTLFNIIFGSILWPFRETFSRGPLFTADGQPLFRSHEKSSLRKRLEAWHLYGLAENARQIVRKLQELATVVAHPSAYAGSRSHSLVAIYTLS
jgi:SAM-dependent methyltransferase